MADEFEGVDPTQPTIITIVGRKRSGKSILAAGFWDSYPYDEICLDVTKDAIVGPGCRFISELPHTFPAPNTDAGLTRTKLVYQPDPGSATYDDDLDRAVGLALHNPRKRCQLWIDERSEFTIHPGPSMRRALAQSRHFGLSILSCGPRAVGFDPLLLSNADFVFIFDTPGVHDRKRLADTLGIDEKLLSTAIFSLPKHGFLMWNAAERRLFDMPPLPADYVRRLMRATPPAEAA